MDFALTLVGLVGLCAGARAQADPIPAAVDVVPSVVTDEGTFELRVSCLPEADVRQSYDLRVALTNDDGDLTVVDHELKPATSKWRAGRQVNYAVPMELFADLAEGAALGPGDEVSVRVGFVASGGGAVRSLGGEWVDYVDEDGLADLLEISVPRFAGPAGKERLKLAIDEADRLRREGDAAAAWSRLDRALRAAQDESTKARIRDELAKVGETEPPAITEDEERIIGQRIRAEKVRVFRGEAGRMYSRGQLHGALKILEEIGGALTVSADEKVLGALRDAERVMERVEDIRERLLTEMTEDQEAAVEALIDKHGTTEKLYDAAETLVEKQRYPEALGCLRALQRRHGIELYERALARLDEVGELQLAAIPEDEADEVTRWLDHPVWARTTYLPSHCFLFIGPEKLVTKIPEASKLRFDLAYVYLTDLFGRVPNPDGDRVTVYFKELFEFGGGIGGGKIIDIGNAEASPKKPVRVDTGLLYHELTHCVDDTRPTHGGFGEGLANLGAAFAHEALEQKGDALHSFDSNLKSFQRYFLDRDLEYWRIQNYGPSAGLFLHFVEEYASVKGGTHRWAPLRRFFREYRDAPVRDGREPFVMRSVAHYLVRAFGTAAFDDLVAFGFPLEESDRWLLRRELETFQVRDELETFDGRFADFPNSQLPRDVVERRLSKASNRKRLEEAEELRRELGVIMDWKVVGPFFAKRADPGAMQFPPELEVDFEEKPRALGSNRRDYERRPWQDPWPSWKGRSGKRNAILHPSGWLKFDYDPYGDDNSAIYALTHVTVPEATEVLIHGRADDDLVVFVNDRRAGAYRGRGNNASTDLGWRGPYEEAADAIKMPARLEAGRNKVLLKIRNRLGTAGAVLAISKPDGSQLDFTADSDPPETPGPRPAVEEPRWRRAVQLDDRSYRSKGRSEVGGFKAKDKRWFGTSTDGEVKWRMFTVRPGFPKDSPSNLLWLKSSVTKGLDALRVDVTFDEDVRPKLVLTFQGEGEDDGLSGWNLILAPAGRDAVLARLERYDRLVYQSDPVKLTGEDGEAKTAEDGRTLSLR
ncbi:MAG: hypothetical protein AAGG01_11745, partial [Planctomycetota bacterium]